MGAVVRSCMQSYGFMDRGGMLPGDGGLDDQAAAWVAFCGQVDAERGRIRRLEQAKRDRNSRMPSLGG